MKLPPNPGLGAGGLRSSSAVGGTMGSVSAASGGVLGAVIAVSPSPEPAGAARVTGVAAGWVGGTGAGGPTAAATDPAESTRRSPKKARPTGHRCNAPNRWNRPDLGAFASGWGPLSTDCPFDPGG